MSNVIIAIVRCLESVGSKLSDCSVAVKVEPVSIDVFHSELTQTPGLALKRFNDSCTKGLQFGVCGVDICGEYPVNGGLERLASTPEENSHIIARHGTDLLSGDQPTNLETE